MPTSPLKRPSGRLGRLLASLHPPARAGPLPVQTGFPTSLADLVVKNRGRLRNPKRRHVRPTAAAAASPAPPAAADPPAPERREVVTAQTNAAVRHDPTTKGAAFTIRPEVLAVGGAVALALLVVWSKWLVAAATAASVALVWVESVRSSAAAAAARRREEATTEGPDASPCGRGLVSPIREAGTPRSSCADSSDAGSEVSFSLWAPDPDAADDSMAPQTSKEKRRPSLRKLIARKLRTGGKRRSSKVDLDTTTCSALPQPDAGGEAVLVNTNNTVPVVVVTKAEPSSPAPAVVDTQTPPLLPEDAVTVVERRVKAEGAGSPSAAALSLVPIILVGLVAGKLPAVALTVLCIVFFFGSPQAQPASADSAGRLGDPVIPAHSSR